MIKAVIFDAGGVLHESNQAVSEDLQQELGLTKAQTDEIWKNQIPRMGMGKLDEAGFWRELAETYGIRHVTSEEKLLTRAMVREMKQNVQVLDIANQLKAAGYTLAVLSDTNALHAEVLDRAGNYNPFEHRFLSHEIGIRKPDLQFFWHALGALGIKAEESIFIDDNEANVRAAQSLGIHGIVFTSTKQFFDELSALLPDAKLTLRPLAEIIL